MSPERKRLIGRGVGSLFGLGFSPVAPGTVASLACTMAAAGLMRLGSAALPEAVLASVLLGLLAIEWAGVGEQDPPWVVIDEAAGQFVALLPLARPSLLGLALGFALFRLLDITKPGPIRAVDRRRNAAGIIGDDLLAGAGAAVVLWGVQAAWPALLR